MAEYSDRWSTMTKEQAKFVRKLRVEEGYTWRAVASACNKEWNGNWGSNQLAGMDICEAAAKHFNENFMQDPWN